jgi:integrase
MPIGAFMTDVPEKIDVKGDGRIILYKREGLKNPKWQARIRVPNSGGYKVITTKTDNLREAERFAVNYYEDLYIHVKSGGSIKSKTFAQVFAEWETATKTMGHTRQGGSWDATVVRLKTTALPYFGAKKIDAITELEFSDYWMWRKNNFSKKKPSNATLRRERTCLMPVFRFAVSRGYISQVPTTNPPKATADRRPTFTLDEWRMIYTKARLWVKEGEKKATGRDRFVAQQYFLILANTGVRVGELRQLRWSDIRTVKAGDGKRLVAYVRGKTGSREVVFQEGADQFVKRLYDLRVEELSGHKPEPDSLVLCHKDGTPITTMKRSFQSLLKYADIPTERDGVARTIYSLRHFYATQRLSHDTSPFLLAKQMGTSVEMLEKFYGQTVTSELANQITKGNQTSSDDEKAYPFE